MARAQCTFQDSILPQVKRLAGSAFRGRPDKAERVNDTISEVWVGMTAKPDAPLRSIVYYAIQRVKIGRQFRASARSLTGPNPRRTMRARLRDIDLADLVSTDANPAELAALRIDFAGWIARLTARQRQAMLAMLAKERTDEIARRFGVTAGAVSQWRRWLVEDWEVYTS